MHVQTHILSGWCVGNLVPRFGARERALCMVAAAMADLDGLGIVVSQEWYWDYHHVLGHNLLYGVVLCAVLAVFSRRGARGLGFVLYLGLYHLHLVMDYYGSGPGWGIAYLWPFSQWQWRNGDAWGFQSWQNLTAAAGMVAWAVLIANRRGRTPLEAVMPNLDAQLARRLGFTPVAKKDEIPPTSGVAEAYD
jgi:hypothetical protein